MNLQNIAALHRASVGLVFSKYGINAPVNGDTIQSAVIVHKQPFIDDIERVIDEQFSYDSNEGDKTKGQKVAETLGNVLKIIAGGIGAYQAGKQLGNPNTTTNPQQKKTEMEKKNMQTFIIGIAAVLVAVLLFVAVTRLKDKTAR